MGVLRRRNFGLVFAGAIISQIGDMALFVALPFWIYRLTGSVAATGTMFIALTLPQLLVSPFAGVFVDRWDRRVTMLVSDLLRVGIVASLLLVHDRDQVWIIYLVGFAESTASRFFLPARAALVPLLVEVEELPQANAMMGICEGVAQLGGPALGGVLIAAAGPHGAVLLDAATYLGSAAAIAAMRLAPTRTHTAVQSASSVRGVLRDLRDGIGIVLSRPALRAVFAMQGLFMLSQGIINALLVVMVSRIWGGGSKELGWLITAEGAGALAGGIVLGGVAGRMSPRTLMLAGGAGCGVFVALLVNQPSVYAGMGLIFLVGILAVCMMIGEQTTMQLGSDDHNRGRVASLMMAVSAASALLATAVTSAVAGRVGILPMLDLAATAMALGGLAALLAPAGMRAEEPAVMAEPAA
jgi:MFS family permease